MFIIVTGVSGSGKTTIGTLLAADLGFLFLEGDEYHPASNIEKMSKGIPLQDEDRWPWLESIRAEMDALRAKGKSAVIACSALKDSYRDFLRGDDVHFVFLAGEFELIEGRMRARRGHFMGPRMLASQFEALELPPDAIMVDASASPATITATIREALPLLG